MGTQETTPRRAIVKIMETGGQRKYPSPSHRLKGLASILARFYKRIKVNTDQDGVHSHFVASQAAC